MMLSQKQLSVLAEPIAWPWLSAADPDSVLTRDSLLTGCSCRQRSSSHWILYPSPTSCFEAVSYIDQGGLDLRPGSQYPAQTSLPAPLSRTLT